MMSLYSWHNLIAYFHVSPRSPHPSLNMNIGQMKVRFLHCRNVILFVGFKYWFFSQLYYLVNIKFTIFIIWIQFVTLATYFTIFRGIYAMIWELFYVFKYMRSNSVFFEGEFLLSTLVIVIFMNLLQQHNKKSQYVIMLEEESTSLQYT